MCKIKKGLVNDIFFVIKLEIARKNAIFAAKCYIYGKSISIIGS
jgi:hypothetical protein